MATAKSYTVSLQILACMSIFECYCTSEQGQISGHDPASPHVRGFESFSISGNIARHEEARAIVCPTVAGSLLL